MSTSRAFPSRTDGSHARYREIVPLLSDRHIEWFGHIRENAERIESYLGGKNYSQFLDDALAHDAIERCLERICEAARRLGSVAEDEIPDLDWKGVRGLGNVLRHDYDQLEQPQIFAS